MPGGGRMGRRVVLIAVLAATAAGGCVSTPLPAPVVARAQAPAPASEFAADKKDDGDSETGNGDKKDKKDDKADDKKKEPPKTLFEWAVGPESRDQDKKDEYEPLETDRPDFTEATSTVGLGRVQVESGYTYYRDRANGVRTVTHTYPELLVRAGMYADWLELRLVQSYTDARTTPAGRPSDRTAGLDDFGIGAKVALVEKKGYLPSLGLIVSTTVPT